MLSLLLIVVALVAAACGSDDEAAESTTTSGADESTTTAPATPTTTAPDDGAMVDAPQAIVSLNPTGTEMLFAVGAGDQVVAVDSFSYYPPEAPVTDLSGFDPNIEAIAAYEPDLVVVDSTAIVDQLEQLGIETLVLEAPADFEGVYDQIELVGAVTGHAEAGIEVAEQMEADIESLVADTPAPDEALAVFHELDPTYFTLTSGTVFGQAYALFGLDNIADAVDDGNTYPQLSEEFILEADPDIVFLADGACCQQDAGTVAARPGWGSVSAVASDAVVVLDEDTASRWGPRLVEFVEDISEAVSALEAA